MFRVRKALAMLTQTQTRDYLRALERAHANGVRVLSSRAYPGDTRQWTVTTDANGHYHVVARQGQGALICDCPATSYCVHRAVVRQYELANRDRERAADEALRLPVLTTISGREAIAAEA